VAGEGPITSVYLNFDFPVPTRDWEGVFDVWLKGDAQRFASAIKEELEKADAAKEAALERKRKREEAAAASGGVQIEPQPKKQKVSRKKPSKPPPSIASASCPTNSDWASRSKATPVSANRTRIERLPSPSDEDSDPSVQRIYLTIPSPRSRPRGDTPPVLPHSLLVRPSPSQKTVQTQMANMKTVFPVTMGKTTAKLK